MPKGWASVSIVLLSLIFVSSKGIADGLQPAPLAPCSEFVKQTGLIKRNIRLLRFNIPETDKIINEVSGVLFVSEETPFIPGTDPAAPENDKNLIKVQAWIKRYESYVDDMYLLKRAVARYLGESEKEISVEEKDDPDNVLRINGRLNIFKETAAQFLAGKAEFPIRLKFPRSPRRQKDHVILPRGSSLLVQHGFKDLDELKGFIKNDEKELRRILTYIVAREIEQAELFARIRQFRAAFPEGSYRKLTARLKAAEERRALEGSKPVDDASFARDHAVVELFRKCAFLLHGRDQTLAALRPTERSLQFIDRLLKTDKEHGFIRARGWVDTGRKYTHWAYDWMAQINKAVGVVRQPVVTYGGLIIIFGAVQTVWHWTKTSVIQPSYDYVVYDAEQIKAREYYESMKKLRLEISVPSVTYQDFYNRYRAYAQDNFSDEAVTIAFEYLRKTRPSLNATKETDPTIPETDLQSHSDQAKEIVKRRDILLYGFKTPFGDVGGVASRLGRRAYNYWLVEQMSDEENKKIENGMKVFTNGPGMLEYGPFLPPDPSTNPVVMPGRK